MTFVNGSLRTHWVVIVLITKRMPISYIQTMPTRSLARLFYESNTLKLVFNRNKNNLISISFLLN